MKIDFENGEQCYDWDVTTYASGRQDVTFSTTWFDKHHEDGAWRSRYVCVPIELVRDMISKIDKNEDGATLIVNSSTQEIIRWEE